MLINLFLLLLYIGRYKEKYLDVYVGLEKVIEGGVIEHPNIQINYDV